MTPQEYIIAELESFIKRFSKVRVRYEYDENALVHTVEVLPNEVYHLNEEYILWERQLFYRFIERYPTENIGFISDDALVGIESAMYVKEGLDYAPFSAKEVSISFDSSSILIQQTSIKEIDNITFADNKVYKPIEKTQVTKGQSDYCKTFFLAA